MQRKRVGIIGGNGRYGTFWTRFFTERGCEVKSSDIGTPLTNQEVVEWAEVVLISVTLMKTEKVIESLIPFFREDQLLMDIASVKFGPVTAMLKSKAGVVGLHPFCAPPQSGTFRGQTIFVCEARLSVWGEWFTAFLTETEAEIEKIEPGQHDTYRTVDQGLEHMCTYIKVQVMKTLGLCPSKLFRVASPVYRLTTLQMGRMFVQSPELYGGIAMSNLVAQTALLHFEWLLGEYLRMVVEKDMTGYRAGFEASATYLGEENLKASLTLSEEVIRLMTECSARGNAENGKK